MGRDRGDTVWQSTLWTQRQARVPQGAGTRAATALPFGQSFNARTLYFRVQNAQGSRRPPMVAIIIPLT
jgi:hypothetical protein